MKMILLTIAFVAALLVSGAIVNGLYANDQNENAGCSLATLKGSWGFYRTGINVFGPYASVGIMFCDGNGNCKRRQAAQFNGAFERNSLSFRYQVAADCTGKFLGEGDGGEFAALSLWIMGMKFTG